MLIAHLADTHLGFRQYGIEEREIDIYSLFEEAVDLAIKEGVEAIVISGDMFDKPRPPNRAIKIAGEVLRRAREHGIRVYSVLGEHDLPKKYDLPPQVLVPYLRLLGTSRTPDVDVIHCGGKDYYIAGVSHHPPRMKYLNMLRRKLSDIMTKVEGRRTVLMLHQNVKQFFMIEEGLDLADLPHEVAYVAMGHLHRRIARKLESGTVVAYAGSIDIMRADEIESWREVGKGFYIVDLSTSEAVVHTINLNVRPQVMLKTSYHRFREDLKVVLSSVSSSDRKGIIHAWVTVPYNVKDDIVKEIRRIVGEKAYVRIRLERVVESSPKGGEEGVELDALSIVASMIGGDPSNRAAREAAAVILKIKDILASDSEEDIEAWIEKLLQYKELWINKVGSLEIVPTSFTDLTRQRGKGLERFMR